LTAGRRPRRANICQGAGAGDEYMLGTDVYAAITWALMWALVFAPFLFKWALGVFQRASPIQRGVSIGGNLMAQRNFVIQVTHR
jgi:hypothetical protein